MSRHIDRWVRNMRDDMAVMAVPQKVEDQFGQYRDNPVAFGTDMSGVSREVRADPSALRYEFTANGKLRMMSGERYTEL